MKNDSTSFFENNHFANSYVYDISISHVPAYFGLHWHHYIEIVLAQDDGIIYEVNGETFPLKPGDLQIFWKNAWISSLLLIFFIRSVF